MAPDLEYFLAMNDQSVYGHTLAGIFYFDVPLTLLTAYLFHRFIKVNLINSLPYFAQRRFYELKQFQFEEYIRKHWFVFLASAVIGSASHLLWDAFTHPRTIIVNSFSIYETVVPFRGVRYPLYYFLQYVSSYTGLFILLLYFFLMKPNPKAELVRPHLLYWVCVTGLTCTIVFLRFYLTNEPINLVLGVISSMTGFGVALFIAGLLPLSHYPVIKVNN